MMSNGKDSGLSPHRIWVNYTVQIFILCNFLPLIMVKYDLVLEELACGTFFVCHLLPLSFLSWHPNQKWSTTVPTEALISTLCYSHLVRGWAVPPCPTTTRSQWSSTASCWRLSGAPWRLWLGLGRHCCHPPAGPTGHSTPTSSACLHYLCLV